MYDILFCLILLKPLYIKNNVVMINDDNSAPIRDT